MGLIVSDLLTYHLAIVSVSVDASIPVIDVNVIIVAIAMFVII